MEKCGMDHVARNRKQWRTAVDIILGLRIAKKITGDKLSDYQLVKECTP
jgi:hypothetical protein